MSLKALQQIRRGVFSVSASAAFYPFREAPIGVPTTANTHVVIGTAFLADASGIFITAGHVITKHLEHLKKFAPRFENGDFSRESRRVVLAVQVQHASEDMIPPDARDRDPDRSAMIFSVNTAAMSFLLDDRYDLGALYTGPFDTRDDRRDPFFPKPMSLAASEGTLGQEVVACGYPFGEMLNRRGGGLLIGNPPTFSRGIIGAILPEWSAPAAMRSAFRFDATILPGNSGGPVCDIDSGRVLGVTSQVAVQRVRHLAHDSQRDETAVPVGFPEAVPVDAVRKFLLRAKERRDTATDFSADLASANTSAEASS